MTTTNTTQTTKMIPTNGQIFKDGQWWMQCGPTLFPIKLTDAGGKPVLPPDEEPTNEQS